MAVILIPANFRRISIHKSPHLLPLLFLHLLPQELIINLFFVDNPLQIFKVTLKEAEYNRTYMIFLSLCRSCQLRLLKIDFCLCS